MFDRLQQAGVIPAGVKFQISIPTPIAPTYNNLVPSDRPRLLPPLTQHFIGEVAKIAAALPNDRIAVQWDVCQEVLAWEGYYEPGPVDFRTETIEVLSTIGNAVPASVELGYHLCYGSPADEHLVQPKDAGIMVEMTNAIAAGVTRPIQFFHMPVPKGRTDDGYFAPLEQLRLRPPTELYLGLIHHDDARATPPGSPPPAGTPASTASAPNAGWRAATRRGCRRCSRRMRAPSSPVEGEYPARALDDGAPSRAASDRAGAALQCRVMELSAIATLVGRRLRRWPGCRGPEVTRERRASPDNSRQSWSQRFRERNHFLLVFRDAVLALVVLIGLSGITWALVFGVGIVAFFVGGPGWSTLSLIPVYGVPALIVAYGVISLRIGAILTPVVVAVIAWTGSAALRQEDQAAIAKFSISALAPASRTHQVLALDGPDVTCDTACHRIIATSDTTLARKSRYSKDWVLFRRGDSCADEVQAISALEFLRDGHRDVCE